MTKAVSVSLGLILMLAGAITADAQNSSTDVAINQAVLRQANTILLRQKLDAAKAEAVRGDLVGAAKSYDEAYTLTEQIGSGIDAETAQTVAGVASTRLQLAREAQSKGDLLEARTQVNRVLVVDPKNAAALTFKQQNEKLIASLRGKIPDEETLQQIPALAKDKTDAATLVQDGKLLYEMGKFEEADAKLREAMKLDPNNQAGYYYLNLIRQAVYKREESKHTLNTQERMVQVEQQWVKPISKAVLPVPNPYAETTAIHTGPGREAIMTKLQRIKLDSVMYDGLPLSEVVRDLSEKAKLRDPDKKGINFLITANGGEVSTTPGLTPGGAGGATAVDPATGLPMTSGAGAASEPVDISSVNIKINPALVDVPLSYALDAIVQVAEKPIKYSIEDFAVVFSPKGAETPQLYMRTFKVDANTFYQGLQAVDSFTFASANTSGGNGGTGGNSGGGNSGDNVSGAVVPIVNIAPGSSSRRSSGGNGGGGGGGGSSGNSGSGGLGLPSSTPGGNNNNNNQNNGGGVSFVTQVGQMADVSVAARTFFSTLGVDLATPKSIFFNDRLGLLFVRATMQDLDTIERAIQALNEVAPQVHIKARFIEVEQDDNKALGFDWYLGQFGSTVTASGGSEASQTVPASSANPSGIFPGNIGAPSQIAQSASDQLITGGLRNTAPAIGTITGILTDPNFRVVIKALEQRSGVETLAEPEVTTTSGRQTQMRATDIKTIITGFDFEQGNGGTTTTTTTQ